MDNYDEDGPYFPQSLSFTKWHDIPHYYGDYVRSLFLAVAVLAGVAIPVFGPIVPLSTVAQVGSIILLVLLAGLTNPHGKILLIADAFVAGLGILLVETVAISLYSIDSFELFVAREVAAVALLFAFYFSIKTLRAMAFGKVGRTEPPSEFENE